MPLQATAGAATYDAFGGGVTAANYIEDVFSTYLYTGNGSTQTITNGIDLAGKGGLVWGKNRSGANAHNLYDTARGAAQRLASNLTNAQANTSPAFSSFNSDGFSLNGSSDININGDSTVSWTFRKQAKFFDVVTYTGNGSNRTISHSLGSVPGCIIVKRTDTAADWQVYHRSLANTEYMVLNDTAAKATGTTRWNSTTPTATEFSLGTDTTVNASGGTYVAYLFAHDAGGFGASGTDNVISCGSFTTDGSGNATVSLGYEPQWLLIKATGNSQNWILVDVMRGMALSPPSNALFPNTSGAEYVYDPVIAYPTATGFYINGASGALFNSASYIYIAIRRGPMRTPTTGTSVFEPKTMTATQANLSITGVGFSPDLVINGVRSDANYGQQVTDRLRGVTKQVFTEYDSAENTTNGTAVVSLNMNGISLGADTAATGWNAYSGYTSVKWMFRRAPGFFDVVCDTGTGSAHTITHNLGVVPELMIRKKRSAADAWIVYAGYNTDYLVLNNALTTIGDSTMWNNTSPTSSVFTVGTNDDVNGNGATFVTYLFASCPGVSKVGSYTGSGTTKQIDCGFTAGARFVLIKNFLGTGDWYVWDSARGIVAGNDPYLLLNSSAAEVTSTDYVDTYSAGFEISSTAPAAINANGGTFIFLAIS